MLNVERLKEDFSIQQINQLIKLEERGFDISYLDSELLTIDRLRLLVKDINSFSNEQKQLIKYGIDKKYNILLYANAFFSEQQMEMIIIGLDKKLDVSYYANAKFNLIQMREIYQLLEYNKVKNKKIDVSKIAKTRYSAAQMHEIKDGLIKGIDTTIYERPDFDSEQMCLIKLGLLKDIDVSLYANPEMEVEEMRKILNNPPKKNIFKKIFGVKCK